MIKVGNGHRFTLGSLSGEGETALGAVEDYLAKSKYDHPTRSDS